jgi:hypothetical protein
MIKIIALWFGPPYNINHLANYQKMIFASDHLYVYVSVHTTGWRFSRTGQYRSAPIPLLAFDSAREEEDSESLEMESRAKQLGWRITKL